MADHLILTHLDVLSSKRVKNSFNPDAPLPDRAVRAATLRGILEGLESSKAFPSLDEGGDLVEQEDTNEGHGEIVLKFTGTQPFKDSAFSKLGMTPLAVTGDKQYFALSDHDARSALAEQVGRYIHLDDTLEDFSKSLQEELEKVEGIDLYGPEDRLAPGIVAPHGEEVAEVDIAIWPTSLQLRSDESRGRKRVAAIASLLDSHTARNPQVQLLNQDSRDPDRLTVHAIVDSIAFQDLAHHHLVERLRGPLTASVTQETLEEYVVPSDALLPEGEPIGIIDDLVVDGNPWLRNVVVEQKSFPDEQTLGHPTRHGTEVAGIAAWGDVRSLLDPHFDGQPIPLYVARVAQANVNFEAQVYGDAATQFSSALDWLAEQKVRIVVLALGESYADLGPLKSDLSALIDEKARTHGMVIVTSAGNINGLDHNRLNTYPHYLQDESSRVAAPGTAALSVTTSAIAEKFQVDRTRTPHARPIAGAGKHAPYGRTGVVHVSKTSGQQKPEFVANGGNWAIDTATNNIVTDDAELSVTTLIPPVNGRLFGPATGTSLAAPRVAHELARIASRYPDASANLLRALLALSGSTKPRRSDAKPKFHSSTYGVPSSAEVLESSENRVIFTFEGSMATDSHAVLEIPIPEVFARGYSKRELSIALAFDPPVRRSRKDYIEGSMQFVFIQKEDLREIKDSFAKQPTHAELHEDSNLARFDSISGSDLYPPKTTFLSDTLIRRNYYRKSQGWDPDDNDYFLVISHDHSRRTDGQKRRYENQSFAVAVEIRDYERDDIDLYAEAQARLADRARSRGGSNQ